MISRKIDNFRGLLILSAAAAGVCLYAYFIPGGIGAEKVLTWNFFTSMGGDLPNYVLRFAAATVFLGVFPAVAFALLMQRNGKQESFAVQVGLTARRNIRLRKRWWAQKSFYVILFFVLCSGVSGAFNSNFAEIYPYSKTLTVNSGELADFLLHAGSYLVFYYLPWELLFRGILILPFLSIFLDNSDEIDMRDITLIGIQVIPSALLHFGHPLGESIGAVLFGILAGWLVLRYRSIWPSFVLHGVAGISLDAMLTLKANI